MSEVDWAVLAERSVYLMIGLVIGTVLGYVARGYREAQIKLDEILETEHEILEQERGQPREEVTDVRDRDEQGFVRTNATNLLMGFLVVVVALSAFQSQTNSNQVADASAAVAETQVQQQHLTDCYGEYLLKTIAAADGRTTYAVDQAQANVGLQKAQAEFLAVLLQRDAEPAESREALQSYFDRLTEFTSLTSQQVTAIEANPYPTSDQFLGCIQNVYEGR